MMINRIILSTIILILVLTVFEAGAAHKNSLRVSIDINQSQINGISRIGVAAGEEIVLHKDNLEIIRVTSDDKQVNYREEENIIIIMPEYDGVIEITFKGTFRKTGSERAAGIAESVIDDRGVSLTGRWYPELESLSYYDLTVTLPEGYEAVSEAEEVRKETRAGKVEFNFVFPHSVDGINLVASDKYRVVKDSYGDVDLYAYFFEEDMGLANTYIEYTKKYLELYEDLIGDFPYKRFSVVENFLPTGYSMPTFTLLGSTVVKLPFIVETSLGHEILHQWFGNLVYIDYEKGNWAEGLTTYLADHLYKEQKGEGQAYRKQIIIGYMSYVSLEKDMPLKLFKSRIDPATSAIGYGKTAMVFHMLMNLTGKNVFYESLRDVIENNKFKRASWDDIRRSFEKVSHADLQWFFSQWTEKEGLPAFELEDLEIKQVGTQYNVHFHVNQTKTFYKLNLPVTIYLKNTVKVDTLAIEKEENGFDFLLPERPRKIVLDENYDIARYLHEKEFTPVIARLLGDEKITVVRPDAEDSIYQDIIEKYEQKDGVIIGAKDIGESDIKESSVIILGNDHPLIGRLYGRILTENAGFSILVRKNPWNTDKVIAIIDATSREEVDAAFRKLRHYGKYTALEFEEGRNTGKAIEESQKGIEMKIDEEATVIDVSALKTLSDVINGVSDKKIVYIGEAHDVFAHHAVQLDVITGIYQNNPNIAIGMEMFQTQFQETLDAYISGEMTEGEFLKKSEYFKRWSFDYNLYKPILDFAKTEKVPVIALNLKREIIDKVSHGGIESLSEEEKAEIPDDLDFSDTEYRKRLKEIFQAHKHSSERGFDHFYQSQILWDETMSRSVDNYLRMNPDRRMIVLAGQGHLRHGSGIPLRTYRRNSLDYATVLIDDDVDKDIADYIVFPKPFEGITAPRLMAFLKDDDGVISIAAFADKSVSEKAGLRKGDRIIFIDDAEISSVDDIRIHLLYKKKGDIIKVKVKRKIFFLVRVVDIDVEL
jgi:uncharacterized iron-regulated protein